MLSLKNEVFMPRPAAVSYFSRFRRASSLNEVKDMVLLDSSQQIFQGSGRASPKMLEISRNTLYVTKTPSVWRAFSRL
jgi:hypothetical protein